MSSFFATPNRGNSATMALYLEKSDDGMYHCPEEQCGLNSLQSSNIRNHCRRVHGFSVTTVRPRAKDERAQKKREDMRALRASKRRKAPAKPRDAFTVQDANERGVHEAAEPIVEYRSSLIPGAGNGVFACVGLQVGDVVTQLEGSYCVSEPQDPDYAIAIEGPRDTSSQEFIDGLRKPESGRGLGSFVNKESRAAGQARKNCEYVQVGRMVYLEIIKDVKANMELYTTYGKGYRVSN